MTFDADLSTRTVSGDVRAPARRRSNAAVFGRIWRERLCSVGLALGFLALAELFSRSGYVSSLLLPPPSDVWRALVGGFGSGLYWPNIVSTLFATGAGFLAAATAAIVVAGIFASLSAVERIMLPFVVAFQSMPKIAIAPLIVLWFGFGSLGKIAIVAITAFFPIMVSTLQGLKIRDRDQFELMHSLGASRWQMFRHLRVQIAMPHIFAGLHVGAIFALLGAVVGEFVGADSGLGYLMLQAKAAFDVPGVFACLLLLMLIGIGLHFFMGFIERRVAFWGHEPAHHRR